MVQLVYLKRSRGITCFAYLPLARPRVRLTGDMNEPVWSKLYRTSFWMAGALIVSGVSSTSVSAQPANRCADSVRVRGIEFVGSPVFDDVTLSLNIATQTPPGVFSRWLFRRSRPCSDSMEVQLDALRIAVLHRQKGWLEASVVPTMASSPKGVQIRFDITPGEVSIIDSVVTTGLPEATGQRLPYDAPLRDLAHTQFDRTVVDSVITGVVSRLKDNGYARVTRPAVHVQIDSATMHATISLAFQPGPLTTIGAIHIDVQGIDSAPATLSALDVQKLTSLREGTRYSASNIVQAQRDLYRSDQFRLVIIDTVAATGAADSLLNLHVSVAEAPTRNARVGAGWATLECVRTQARLVDRRFLGVTRRVELTARASRIGVGPPVDFAPRLCSRALRADTQFTVFNYYAGATVSNTRLFGWPLSPVLTLYTERRSEPYAYIRETGVGVLTELSRQFTNRTSGTGGLQYENGRTKIDPAEACSRFGQCRQEEYDQAVFGRGVGIISTTLSHDQTNNRVNPNRGFRVTGELRAGQTFANSDDNTGNDNSSLRFYRTSGSGSTYIRALGGVVAMRVQAARAFAPGASLVDGSPLIPQQERLFAGGQSTVRGFQQNLLGPLVYVVSNVTETTNDGVTVYETVANADYDRAVPRGGTAMTVANLEFRRGFRAFAEEVQVAAFVDVGNVWEGGSSPFRFGDLRATPGLGVRVFTALGPFRVDIGYQPYNPRAGRALYVSPGVNGASGTINCASPGNTVSIDPNNPGSIFDCPETYRPPSARGTLSRLVFHFGLGQAF